MTNAINQSGSVAVSVTQFSTETTCGLSVEERMLALIVYNQSAQLQAGETQVEQNAEELEKLRADVARALKEAREANEDAGLWGDIADFFGSDLASIATAVAAVAAVVASGGAAAAVLGAIAAAAALAADHAEELGIPPEVAVAIAVAASVASLACGNAKGLIDVSAKVVDVAKEVKVYSGVVAGAARAVGGGASAVQGSYEQDAAYLQADARRGEGYQELANADIDAAIDSLQNALERQLEAAKLASDIQNRSDTSKSAIIDNWLGAA